MEEQLVLYIATDHKNKHLKLPIFWYKFGTGLLLTMKKYGKYNDSKYLLNSYSY